MATDCEHLHVLLLRVKTAKIRRMETEAPSK
jgi:hypothetical protein